MRIFYHPHFKGAYQKLPLQIQKKAEKKESVFRANPFDSRLKTHKLHGRLKNQWSFSIDQRYRVVFEFYGSEVIFLAVGDHDIYR